MKYKILLFDLDGTLFDYDQAEQSALKKTFELFGINFIDRFINEYRVVNKRIWIDYEGGLISQKELKIERFKRFAELIGIEIDVPGFAESYLNHLSEGRYLIAGTMKIIPYLSRYCKLFLITNGLKLVQRRRLRGSEITEYFSDIFISEEIGHAKPGPEIFEVAFKRMGSPFRENVLMIGDSLSSDIAGGIGYGVDTCWFNPDRKINESKFAPTYEINELLELLEIINPNGGKNGEKN